MSNVIAFKTERSNKTAIVPLDEAGRILLFTGVRYMRDEEELMTEAVAIPTATSEGPTASESNTERLQA